MKKIFKNKKFVIIILIIILTIICFYLFKLFKLNIIDNKYIYFGYENKMVISLASPLVPTEDEKEMQGGWYEYYYINSYGFIVKEEGDANGIDSISLISKISKKELEELENYIISEVEIINQNNTDSEESSDDSSNIINTLLNNYDEYSVYIKDKIYCDNEDLVLNLIDRIIGN